MNKKNDLANPGDGNVKKYVVVALALLICILMMINLYYGLVLITQAYDAICELINKTAGFISYETAIIVLIIMAASTIAYATAWIMSIGIKTTIDVYYSFIEPL